MAIELISDALRNSRATGLDKFVLVCLANYATTEGLSWPSVAKISWHCGISESSVHKCLKSLLKLGEIEVFEIGGTIFGEKKPNKYQLRIPKDKFVRSPGKRIPLEKKILRIITGAHPAPVRNTHGSVECTGTQSARVRNTEQTGAQSVPDPVRTTHPIRYLDPLINRQYEKKAAPEELVLVGDSGKKKTSKVKPVSANPPSIEEFVGYAVAIGVHAKSAEHQYRIWEASNWVDGFGTTIFSWKAKLQTFKAKDCFAFKPEILRPGESRKPRII